MGKNRAEISHSLLTESSLQQKLLSDRLNFIAIAQQKATGSDRIRNRDPFKRSFESSQ
jgi:hypothetical protein